MRVGLCDAAMGQHDQRFFAPGFPGTGLGQGELRLHDHGRIQLAAGDLGIKVVRRAGIHEQRHQRIFHRQLGQYRRQDAGQGAGHRAQSEAAGKGFFVGNGAQVAHTRQQGLHLGQDGPAGFGGSHRAAGAGDQRHAQLRLQRFQALGDAGGREAEAARGFRDRAMLDHQQKAFQKLRVHPARTLSFTKCSVHRWFVCGRSFAVAQRSCGSSVYSLQESSFCSFSCRFPCGGWRIARMIKRMRV